MGGVLAWVECLCGWCAGVGGMLKWVACLCGYHASVDGVSGVLILNVDVEILP